MIEVSDDQFQDLINQALIELPGDHADSIANIAIIYEDLPSEQQRQTLKLRHNQTLLGLYEGLPLPQRQGLTRLLPDKITLFKIPLQNHANNTDELKEQIKHTLWHEIAHYYGLDHDKISSLE
ncbi:MAG: metallopeptidase family protein [Candidatus Saccharimonadales bacterium]